MQNNHLDIINRYNLQIAEKQNVLIAHFETDLNMFNNNIFMAFNFNFQKFQ